MFIAIEGIDASGKSTQSKLLANRLKAELFKFPDPNTTTGKMLYGHLNGHWYAGCVDDDGHRELNQKNLDAAVFQCIQVANRMEHAQRMQEILYHDQKTLITDRYTASAMVYGGMEGLDLEWLININAYLPQPDVWLLVDVDVKQSLERRPEGRDRFESNLDFLESVSTGYKKLWEDAPMPGAWCVIDGRRPVGDVHLAILKAIELHVSIF